MNNKDIECTPVIQVFTNRNTGQHRMTYSLCEFNSLKESIRRMTYATHKMANLDKDDLIIIEEYTYKVIIINRLNFEKEEVDSSNLACEIIDYVALNVQGKQTITKFGYDDYANVLLKRKKKAKKGMLDLLEVDKLEDDSIYEVDRTIISYDEFKTRVGYTPNGVSKLMLINYMDKVNSILFSDAENLMLVMFDDKTYYNLNVSEKTYRALKHSLVGDRK